MLHARALLAMLSSPSGMFGGQLCCCVYASGWHLDVDVDGMRMWWINSHCCIHVFIVYLLLQFVLQWWLDRACT